MAIMDTIKLDLTAEDAKDMLGFYESKLDELIRTNRDVIKKYNDLLDKTRKINTLLDRNNMAHAGKQGSTSGIALPVNNGMVFQAYPINGTWKAKIKFCLDEEPKGLTSRQIMDRIAAKEAISNNNIDALNRIRIGVSATLSTNSGEYGTYIRDKNKEGDYVYRLRQ